MAALRLAKSCLRPTQNSLLHLALTASFTQRMAFHITTKVSERLPPDQPMVRVKPNWLQNPQHEAHRESKDAIDEMHKRLTELEGSVSGMERASKGLPAVNSETSVTHRLEEARKEQREKGIRDRKEREMEEEMQSMRMQLEATKEWMAKWQHAREDLEREQQERGQSGMRKESAGPVEAAKVGAKAEGESKTGEPAGKLTAREGKENDEESSEKDDTVSILICGSMVLLLPVLIVSHEWILEKGTEFRRMIEGNELKEQLEGLKEQLKGLKKELKELNAEREKCPAWRERKAEQQAEDERIKAKLRKDDEWSENYERQRKEEKRVRKIYEREKREGKWA